MPRERVLWIDLVRLLAIFMLICCHSADGFNFFPGTISNIEQYKWWGAVWGSLVRPCVPLFVMMTGALLLPCDDNMRTIYTRRISRVLWPFLIWSCIYTLFPWFIGILGYSPDVVQIFFPYSGQQGTNQSILTALDYIASIPLNINLIDVHMWYIYVIIGLYLYLPIFSSWVRHADERDKLIFLAIWAVTLFIPYIHHFGISFIWGECDWNPFGMLWYFAGFNGYLLLGHYLRYHTMKPCKALAIGITAFVLGYVVAFNGFKWILNNQHIPSDLELFWFYCSPQVMLMTAGIFITVASFGNIIGRFSTFLSSWGTSLTRCGFGIYMVHYLMTGPAVYIMRLIGVPVGLQIPCSAIVVLAISWTFTAFVHFLFGQKGKYLMG